MPSPLQLPTRVACTLGFTPAAVGGMVVRGGFSTATVDAAPAVLPARSEGNSSSLRSRTEGAEEGEHAARGGRERRRQRGDGSARGEGSVRWGGTRGGVGFLTARAAPLFSLFFLPQTSQLHRDTGPTVESADRVFRRKIRGSHAVTQSHSFSLLHMHSS